jgi:formylmethanofuran dehydrogenase subunit E
MLRKACTAIVVILHLEYLLPAHYPFFRYPVVGRSVLRDSLVITQLLRCARCGEIIVESNDQRLGAWQVGRCVRVDIRL